MSVSILFAAAAGVFLYAPVSAGLVRQWLTDDTASHGILLILAACFLAYRRAERLRTLPGAPHPFGLALVGLGMVTYLLGTLMGEIFVQRASVPMAVAGGIVALAGVSHLRALTAPVVLLALSIPLPAVLVTYATMPLQLAASQVAAGTLQAASIDVVRHGNLLVLDAVTLEVAEACNGLRSLVSLISVGAIAGAVLPIGPWRTGALVAAAFPIAIVGNGLRVAATGVLSTMFGEWAARGMVHDLTGYVAFIVMCAATLAILPLTRPRRRDTQTAAPALAEKAI